MAKKKKVIPLNMDNVEKIHNKLSKQVEATIENEFGYFKFKHDVFFLQSKILRVVRDLAMIIRDMHQKVGPEHVESTFHGIVGLMIIKHFTDIEVPDTLEGQVAFLNKLLDLKLYNEIIQHFPTEELGKVYEEIMKIIESWEGKEELIKEEIKKIEQQIENEEVKELLPKDFVEDNDTNGE